MVSQENRLSNWIYGALVTVGVGLVVLGLVLLITGSNISDIVLSGEPDSPELPSQTNAGQASHAPLSGVLIFDQTINWNEFVPGQNGQIALTALEMFGSAAYSGDRPLVTIVEVGSYGCTACRMVHQKGMLQDLFKAHPDSLRYVFVPWPVIHVNDKKATEAVICALDQGNDIFWAYHNALLDLSDEQYDRYKTYAHYTNLAEQIDGLNSMVFNECLIDGTHRDFVYALTEVGTEMKLKGTPTFFVNGEMTTARTLEKIVENHLDY